MIYQLKVTLKHTKPPIWRRLQVDADTTFYQLHEMIQIAFDWGGYHLHVFDTTKIPEDKYQKSSTRKDDLLGINLFSSRERAEIGNPEFDEGWGMFFDERKEKLSDWLRQEKDRITYTYDFGDDWQHLILLEKILPPEEGVQYPRCVKVRHLPPEEDSRGEWLEAEWTEAHPDHITDAALNKEIQDRVNRFFREEADMLTVTSQTSARGDTEQHNVDQMTQWRTLFELADQFRRLQPWQWMADIDLFAVVDPESGETGYCCVMGEAGEMFGLAVYVGEEGFRSLIELTENEEADPYHQRSLLLSFENRADLTNNDYRLIKELGLSYRGRHAWPTFRSLAPGYAPWYLEEWEMRFLKNVLGQALDVCKRVKDDPQLLDAEDGELFARVAQQTDSGYDWEDSFVPDSVVVEKLPTILHVSEDELGRIRETYPIHEQILECDVDYYFEPVQDNKDERPYFPYLYLCIDAASEMIVDYQLLPHELAPAHVQHSFVQLVQKMKFIPSTMHIRNEDTYRILAPLALELAIELVPTELPIIQRAKRGMIF